MFTGIIQEQGIIHNISGHSGKKIFLITCHKMQDQLKIGDSICTNGICLSVSDFSKNSISLEAMNETLNKTTAGFWKYNQSLHLERAMKLSDRLDGHIVQGHVDTISPLIKKNKIKDTIYLEFSLDQNLKQFIVQQGSISIDGVSLTISKIIDHSFQVSIISLTENSTHLTKLKLGDYVNLEFDILGKYVLNKISKKNTLSESFLIENGF